MCYRSFWVSLLKGCRRVPPPATAPSWARWPTVACGAGRRPDRAARPTEHADLRLLPGMGLRRPRRPPLRHRRRGARGLRPAGFFGVVAAGPAQVSDKDAVRHWTELGIGVLDPYPGGETYQRFIAPRLENWRGAYTRRTTTGSSRSSGPTTRTACSASPRASAEPERRAKAEGLPRLGVGPPPRARGRRHTAVSAARSCTRPRIRASCSAELVLIRAVIPAVSTGACGFIRKSCTQRSSVPPSTS